MGLHDEELEALAARVYAIRVAAGHHDDRRAACSSQLQSQLEFEGKEAAAAECLAWDSGGGSAGSSESVCLDVRSDEQQLKCSPDYPRCKGA